MFNFKNNTNKIMIIVLATLMGTEALFLQEINTGEVGIHKVQGKLQPYILQPGWHFYVPYYSKVVPIKVQQDVDTFSGTWEGCGSSDGNSLLFHDIRVTNQPSSNPEHILDMVERFGTDYEKMLIANIIFKVISDTCSTMTHDEIYRTRFDEFDDLIRESLTNFQVEHNTHLQIINVAVKKPGIKEQFTQNYDLKTDEEGKIINQKTIQERVLQEKLTQKMSEEQDAIRQKSVSQTHKEQLKMEAEADRAIQSIQDAKQAESIKIAADAEAYKHRTLAVAEKERLTPQYLQSEYNRFVVAKASAFYGDKLPKFVMQQGSGQAAAAEAATAEAAAAWVWAVKNTFTTNQVMSEL